MAHSFQFRIEHADHGRRLDEFLASRFAVISRMRIATMIEAGACLVNGATAVAGYHVAVDDAVDISFDEVDPTAMTPEPIPLEIIYEDSDILVVVKPSGMLVHPTMRVKTGTLANALAYHVNKSLIEDGRWTIESLASTHQATATVTRPGMVHRLDRATSGLMVVAKSPRALAVLSRHFRKRLVEKRYMALVAGVVSPETGSISASIGRDPDKRPQWRVMESGRNAETRFKVIKRMGLATLLELEPVTGRTNQLRIHCAHIGHPIVGDQMFGTPFEPNMFRPPLESRNECQEAVEQSEFQESEFEPRLCLHASSLAFHHPLNGEWLKFTSPLPDDMRSIVDRFDFGLF